MVLDKKNEMLKTLQRQLKIKDNFDWKKFTKAFGSSELKIFFNYLCIVRL